MSTHKPSQAEEEYIIKQEALVRHKAAVEKAQKLAATDREERKKAQPDVPELVRKDSPLRSRIERVEVRRPPRGYHVSLWHGLWMPKGTPQPIMDRLNAAVAEALADPTVQGKLAAIGQDIFPPQRQNPQALDAHQRAEIAKWWPLIKEAGIKAD